MDVFPAGQVLMNTNSQSEYSAHSTVNPNSA